MFRAVIIDDEQKGINGLKLLIQKFVDDVKVVAETTDAHQGVGLIDDYRPEIVFLDINMPHLNGFELLKRLKFLEFHLIFTTAHEEYALQAIKSRALEYLLKPIDIDDLEFALKKVREKSKKEELPDVMKLVYDLSNLQQKISIPVRDGMENIDTAHIVRLEADSNYTRVLMADNTLYNVSRTLKEFEQQLCVSGSHFMRIHQSHIVNLKYTTKYIKEDGGMVVTKDNYQIPLSKNKKEDFLRWIGMSE